MAGHPYRGGVVWSRRFVRARGRPSFLIGRDAETPPGVPCRSSGPDCCRPIPHRAISVRFVGVSAYGWRETVYRAPYSAREPLLNRGSPGIGAYQCLFVPAKTEKESFGYIRDPIDSPAEDSGPAMVWNLELHFNERQRGYDSGSVRSLATDCVVGSFLSVHRWSKNQGLTNRPS